MLVLQAMLARDALPGELHIDDLVDEFARLARRSARLAADVAADLADRNALKAYVIANPVNAWAGGRAATGDPYFEFESNVFRTTARIGSADPATLRGLVRELVDWRLAAYLDRNPPDPDTSMRIVCKVSHNGRNPIVFLDRAKYPKTPTGWTKLIIEGEEYEGNFVMIALNVVRRPGDTANVLPDLLQEMFGDKAGASGTSHAIALTPNTDGSLVVSGLRPLMSK